MTVTSAKEYQQPTFIAARGVRNITPADADLTDIALQLYVTGAGNLRITGLDGVDVTIAISSAMVAGGAFVLPCCVVRVWSTNTTATGIFALV